MEEREAIARLKRGDISGLATLVQTYQLRALRAAYLITHDRVMAEDIVQTAFLRAHERIAQFDPSRPFGPWFLKSVVNDAVKAAARDRRQVSLEAETVEESGPISFLVDSSADPAQMLEGAETQAAVRDALGRLSPRQRAAIVLHYYLGLSEAEMMEELGWPRSSVKWHLHAARKRLRELLGMLRPLEARRARREEL